MTELLTQDITTTEVFDWKGVHLFHYPTSSCSQKTRIFMNVKGVVWESHLVDLSKCENYAPWYLGINPRGLVPTLVLDGRVHIESNDIIQVLDKRFSKNRLIPEGFEKQVSELLRYEDDLHINLRTLTFRFTKPQGKAPKSAENLEKYRQGGTGTVRGKKDSNKEREIFFWENTAREGITDREVRVSAERFRAAFSELNDKLTRSPFLLGKQLSVLDIAWFVYANRLIQCGYPLKDLHPRLTTWFNSLLVRPEFASEIVTSSKAKRTADGNKREEIGPTLVDIAGW